MPSTAVRYRGRFAPSPTGPLHLGSLIAALASFLDARSRGGEWLLRMEDLDPPREPPGAAAAILGGLRAHGLVWDGAVLYQSERSAAYQEALPRLRGAGVLFACECTRQRLGPGGCCDGRCRTRQQELEPPLALRVAVPPDAAIVFEDRLQGIQRTDLGREIPDFIVRRKDGLYAYQLAVVVDDAYQRITDIVRGSDLLDSTPRQLWLQRLLEAPAPRYLHLPVVTDEYGQKLSKQNRAPALSDDRAADNLRQALAFLGQCAPPTALRSVTDILSHARAHWAPQRIPHRLAVPAAAAPR